jgi:MFS superfamily sulfate permease-like transporter
MGVVALVMLVLGQAFLKNRPVALPVVIGGVVAASLMDAGAKGVKLLRNIPQGLPPLGLAAVQWSDVDDLLPLATVCFLPAAVETIAIGRMFARKQGYRLDANQEFLTFAAASVDAGMGRGFRVSGGISQSLMNEAAAHAHRSRVSSRL